MKLYNLILWKNISYKTAEWFQFNESNKNDFVLLIMYWLIWMMYIIHRRKILSDSVFLKKAPTLIHSVKMRKKLRPVDFLLEERQIICFFHLQTIHLPFLHHPDSEYNERVFVSSFETYLRCLTLYSFIDLFLHLYTWCTNWSNRKADDE